MEQRQMPPAGVDADRKEPRQDPHAGPHDPKIGGHQQVDAGADGSATARGDRWDPELADAVERSVDAADRLVVFGVRRVLARASQHVTVRPGTEVPTGALDHGSADLAVRIDLVADRDELLGHRWGQGVPAFRGVEGHDRYPVLDPHLHLLSLAHRRSHRRSSGKPSWHMSASTRRWRRSTAACWARAVARAASLSVPA